MNDIQEVISIDGVELTHKQYQTILNHLKYDRLKEHVDVAEKKRTSDTYGLVQRYMGQLDEQTRKSYRKPLERFGSFVTHFFDVDTETVDAYVTDLKSNYAPASVHLHIAALSGLYRALKRWGYIKENPFTGVKLPKNKRTKELVVPDKEDVDIVLKHFQKMMCSENSRRKEAGRKGFLSVYLMSTLGLRIGALSRFSFVDGGYISHSKGKPVSGPLEQADRDYLAQFVDVNAEYPFFDLSESLIQYHIDRAVHVLMDNRRIKKAYHAHSFRHYFAVSLYRKTKDIYEVSRKLNHSSVGVTQRYLASIEVV
jgi:site-specific recombinase XerD